jgi:hypothetical protein
VQDADDGDTTTCVETLIEAAAQVETVRPDGEGIEEIVGDKGYHSNQSLVDFVAGAGRADREYADDCGTPRRALRGSTAPRRAPRTALRPSL